MWVADIPITCDVRREMTENVIPAAREFLKSISSYYSLADIDCMDGIRVQEPFHIGALEGLFSIRYKAGESKGCISCSFLTYPAAAIGKRLQRVLERMDMSTAVIYPDVYYRDGDCRIPWNERTKWTIEFDFETGGDLCEAFTHAYKEILRAADKCFLSYKKYEKKRDQYEKKRDRGLYYSKFYRFVPDDFSWEEGEHVNPYGLLHGEFFLGDRYRRKVTEDGGSTEKVFSQEGIDFVYTSVNVKKDRLCSPPAVTVMCETEVVEDIGEPYTSNAEFTQSFSIAQPCGNVRSLLHNGKPVARLRYVKPDVFVLQPLDIYLEKPLSGREGACEKTEYLIVTKDPDGSYSFFAETGRKGGIGKPDQQAYQHRLVAWSGINTDESWDAENGERYELSVLYNIRHMLPFFAAIEDWAFEPESSSADGHEVRDEKNYSTQGAAEERSFIELNKECRKLISKVREWLREEPDEADEFLGSPGARILTSLEWVRPDLLKKFEESRDRDLMEDIFLVQRVKAAAYGVASDQGLSEIHRRLRAVGLGDPPDCR